eukprot:TRINITY_DN5632_c0_g1_i8.p1 TRINITY_DN5632_c0_g1~~TRINITY_DN5632_c0_g1_i8.p1  ORF type:complete len:884 (-),score=354.28 TRINITY_DN5632_c0_g1_i8:247-2583(-)
MDASEAKACLDAVEQQADDAAVDEEVAVPEAVLEAQPSTDSNQDLQSGDGVVDQADGAAAEKLDDDVAEDVREEDDVAEDVHEDEAGDEDEESVKRADASLEKDMSVDVADPEASPTKPAAEDEMEDDKVNVEVTAMDDGVVEECSETLKQQGDDVVVDEEAAVQETSHDAANMHDSAQELREGDDAAASRQEPDDSVVEQAEGAAAEKLVEDVAEDVREDDVVADAVQENEAVEEDGESVKGADADEEKDMSVDAADPEASPTKPAAEDEMEEFKADDADIAMDDSEANAVEQQVDDVVVDDGAVVHETDPKDANVQDSEHSSHVADDAAAGPQEPDDSVVEQAEGAAAEKLDGDVAEDVREEDDVAEDVHEDEAGDEDEESVKGADASEEKDMPVDAVEPEAAPKPDGDDEMKKEEAFAMDASEAKACLDAVEQQADDAAVDEEVAVPEAVLEAQPSTDSNQDLQSGDGVVDQADGAAAEKLDDDVAEDVREEDDVAEDVHENEAAEEEEENVKGADTSEQDMSADKVDSAAAPIEPVCDVETKDHIDEVDAAEELKEEDGDKTCVDDEQKVVVDATGADAVEQADVADDEDTGVEKGLSDEEHDKKNETPNKLNDALAQSPVVKRSRVSFAPSEAEGADEDVDQDDSEYDESPRPAKRLRTSFASSAAIRDAAAEMDGMSDSDEDEEDAAEAEAQDESDEDASASASPGGTKRSRASIESRAPGSTEVDTVECAEGSPHPAEAEDDAECQSDEESAASSPAAKRARTSLENVEEL